MKAVKLYTRKASVYPEALRAHEESTYVSRSPTQLNNYLKPYIITV